MNRTLEQILEIVRAPKYHPVKVRELAKKLKIPESEYQSFRRSVKELMASGKLGTLRGNCIGPPVKIQTIIGTLSVTRSGRAFVMPDGGGDEVAITDYGLGTALDDDKVEVRIVGKNIKGKATGEVVSVVERKTTQIVGTYHQTRSYSCVRPDDPRLKIEIAVAPPKGMTLQEGAKVVVILGEWTDPKMRPTGKIVEVLGMPGDPGVDILSIIHRFSLPIKFPHAVEVEAEAAPTEISADEIARRLDLRNTITVTIDPEDAKDHDDAVSLEVTESGYQLGVHIADVSHYVQPNGHLDKESRARAASAYLVDRVLPMLPEKLSNNICSLRAGVDRLTMSAMINLDKSGNVIDTKFYESVIRSQAKLSYDMVQEFLDTGSGFEDKPGIAQRLSKMEELARKLIEKRLQTGSIDFEVAEYKVVLDSDGWPQKVYRRERKMSHRVVEEFMLLANKLVASELLARNVPVLYRVHPSPDEKKLNAFILFARNFGHKASFGSPPRAKFISDFIMSLRGKDEQELLNELLIRSMQKAYYDPENIGHFGLAFASYLHFTSPIRRYPDLVVHRILKQVINGEYQHSRSGALKASLTRIGKHCSEQEIVIMTAERETLAVKQAEYLSRQLGEVYEGVISGMLKFGFFVRIVDVGAEGLVRLSTLEDDFYVADVERFVVIGKNSQRKFHLGDKIRVQIVNVDLQSGEIDLYLVEDRKRSRIAKTPQKRRRRR